MTDVAVLGLIILVVGLLITPSAHHRIAEDGEASHHFIRFLTRVSLSTLPIFAVAIGLDLGIAGIRIGGLATGIAGAFLGAVLPLAIWFGPVLFHHPHEDEDMSTSDKKTPLDAKIDYVLTEARVVLPGAQALLGFLLRPSSAAFQTTPDWLGAFPSTCRATLTRWKPLDANAAPMLVSISPVAQ